MLKSKILTAAPFVLGVVGIVFLVLGFSKAQADNTLGDLNDQKALLTLRIEQTQAEYAKVSQERQDAQESCNIALQKSEQLKQLSELNGARRGEIKAIDQKLSTLQSDLTLSQ